MKRLLPVVVLTVLASRATAQEPSAKDLRTLLHADVKAYANDGRLVATWPFRKPDDLKAFTNQDPAHIRILADEGLEMSADATGRALLLFKELEFQQPCTIAFDLKVSDADSSFNLFLGDSAKPGTRLIGGANASRSAGTRDRFDYLGILENGRPRGAPKSSTSAIRPGSWTPMSVELKKDRARLLVAGIEECALDVTEFRSFIAYFGATSGKVLLRDLTVDSQVNRDSIRKLFRSVRAATTSRPKVTNPALIHANAWRKIREETGFLALSTSQAAEVATLPSEAKAAVEAGLDWTEQHKTHEALECFEKAVGIAPKCAVVLWLAGIAASGEDQIAKAIAYLETAVAANAALAPAWKALGEARAERDEDATALKAFEQAEALDPADPWVHVSRAELHMSRARLTDARRDVDRALVKKPESEGLKLLAKSLERLTARPDWKDAFKKESTPPWYVVETTISSKAAADMAQRLVVYRRHLEKAFPLPIRQTAPSRVWVFDSEEEYKLFATSIGNSHENTLGLYHMLLKTLLLTSKVSDDTTRHILFHEAFHQYFDLAVARPPIWLNEGLAEYFGATTFDVSGRATEGGIVAMRLPALQGSLLPIRKLMQLTPAAFMNPRGVGLHYAQSWALVHYFKQSGEATYARMFQSYCDAVISGKSQDDAYTFAFERPDLPAIALIDKDFRRYVLRLCGR